MFSSWFDVFKEDGHNKLIENFKNEEIDYRLEFIFKDSEYNIDKLETKVTEQMEIFSKFK